MSITAVITQCRVPQTSSHAKGRNTQSVHDASPIVLAATSALRLLRNAIHAEKAGLRSEAAQFCITDQLRRAAVQWDQVEDAFNKTASLPTANGPEAELAMFCAQIAIYLDDADNAEGINPLRFRPSVPMTSSAGARDDAAALFKVAQVLLKTYVGLLPSNVEQRSLQAA